MGTDFIKAQQGLNLLINEKKMETLKLLLPPPTFLFIKIYLSKLER